MKRASLAAALVLSTLIAIPALVVFPLAVTASHFFEIDGFSLDWYRNAATPFWLHAGVLSLWLGIVAACLAVVTAIVAVYFGQGVMRGAFNRILDVAAVSILLVPPISLAVGYFRLAGESGPGVLLLGHVVLGYAVAYLTVRAGARNVKPAVVDAAALLGAPPAAILVRIWLPVMARSIAAAWMLAFMTSWDETVLSVFITNPGTITLPKAIWQSMLRDRDLTAAAINSLTAPVLAVLGILILSRQQMDEAPASR